ncbi:S-layer protein [Paenibacillus selenitireducens]|uniref:S-layer protein n=1 Tax=Paenibacillus selenitireducens TaxID=1324314 RepID=A0A1T2XHU5_9BACL|nr:S-layer homology domain-containing protein [Paenibacillus selenitireducens]OPA79233.1 S-layer protein [Paenibacillus selenitireducens]
MRTQHKLIALSAAVAVFLSLAGQSFAAEAPFTDLNQVTETEKITLLQSQGYLHGVGSDRFMPYAELTAAQGIQLMVNSLGLNIDFIKFVKQPQATDYYPKADNDAWYAKALVIAAYHHVDVTADLDPQAVWTREEFTYQLMNTMEANIALPMVKIAPVDVADEKDIAGDRIGAIQRALALHIVTLDESGKFRPQEPMTRIEAAVLVYHALQYIEKHTVPVTE